MFNSKMTIKFYRGGFTSPVLGNVYIGRVATLNKKTAQAFIDKDQAINYDNAESADEVYEAKLIELSALRNAPLAPIIGSDDLTDDDADADLELENEDDEDSGEDDGLPDGDGTEDQQEDAGDAGEDAPPLTLDAALNSLNAADDSHWTKKGLPDLNVLKEKMGHQVTRAQIDAAIPEFTRETLAGKK